MSRTPGLIISQKIHESRAVHCENSGRSLGFADVVFEPISKGQL